MKTLGLTVFAAGMWMTQAVAQTADSMIRDVISGQLDAFQADDFDRAFSYASPMIEQMFGSAERFGQMVQNGYPMVWRPADIHFGGLTDRDGRMLQSVLLTDQAGVVHVLEYEMIETGEGWEINGVRFQRPGKLGA